jgi:hypothetical protein
VDQDSGCDVGEHVHVFLGMEIRMVEVATVGGDRNVFLMTWPWLGKMDWWSMENQTEVESRTTV